MAPPRKLSVLFTRVRQEDALLYDWMRDHHDEFAAELAAVPVRNRWKRALKVIAERKLVDDRGNPATRDTAIRTWKRVREDVAAARAKRQGKPPPALAPSELAPGVQAAPGSDRDAATRPRTRLDIRPATPLANTSARSLLPVASPIPPLSTPVGAGSAATPVQAQPGEGAAEQVRRLREQMESGKVPVPKIVT